MGGMENVMAALAEKFGKAGCGYRASQKTNPKYTQLSDRPPALAQMRNVYKRRYLAGNLTKDDLVICDSWKSVAAVPSHDGKLVVLAHGQEYLKIGRRAKRVQAALNRATHIVSSSKFTLSLIRKNWDIEHLHACIYRQHICSQIRRTMQAMRLTRC